MPRKNKAELRAYRKEYYHGHKKQEKARKQTPEYKAQQQKYMRKRRKRAKEEVDKIFPRECFLCSRTDGQLEMHEIYNKNHPRHGLQALQYYLDHREDFVRLCAKCHRVVTWLHAKFGKNWGEVIAFLKSQGK